MASIVPPYFAGLNPEQREAVETLDGPVLAGCLVETCALALSG
jgi:hypothetical protein